MHAGVAMQQSAVSFYCPPPGIRGQLYSFVATVSQVEKAVRFPSSTCPLRRLNITTQGTCNNVAPIMYHTPQVHRVLRFIFSCLFNSLSSVRLLPSRSHVPWYSNRLVPSLSKKTRHTPLTNRLRPRFKQMYTIMAREKSKKLE